MMPGRNTFTATSRPSVVRAKWTWAIEAAATAVSSNEANIVSIGRENSASISARASPPRCGGREGIERKQCVVPRQRQPDPDQPGEIADAPQEPEPGSERVRGAKRNGAQRRPPSGCG